MNETEIRLLLKKIIAIIDGVPTMDDVITATTAYAQDDAINEIYALCEKILEDLPYWLFKFEYLDKYIFSKPLRRNKDDWNRNDTRRVS